MSAVSEEVRDELAESSADATESLSAHLKYLRDTLVKYKITFDENGETNNATTSKLILQRDGDQRGLHKLCTYLEQYEIAKAKSEASKTSNPSEKKSAPKA